METLKRSSARSAGQFLSRQLMCRSDRDDYHRARGSASSPLPDDRQGLPLTIEPRLFDDRLALPIDQDGFGQGAATDAGSGMTHRRPFSECPVIAVRPLAITPHL